MKESLSNWLRSFPWTSDQSLLTNRPIFLRLTFFFLTLGWIWGSHDNICKLSSCKESRINRFNCVYTDNYYTTEPKIIEPEPIAIGRYIIRCHSILMFPLDSSSYDCATKTCKQILFSTTIALGNPLIMMSSISVIPKIRGCLNHE